MARVVERRKGVPWLLIVFVFLWVVSTTVAVLLYTEREGLQTKVAEGEDFRSQMTKTEQPPNMPKEAWERKLADPHEALLKDARTSKTGVIQQMLVREQQLVSVIQGDGSDATQAKAVQDALNTLAKDKDGRARGLIISLETLRAGEVQLNAKVKELASAADDSVKQVEALQGEIQKIADEKDAQYAIYKTQIAELTTANQKLTTDHQTEVARIKKQYEERINIALQDNYRNANLLQEARNELRKVKLQKEITERQLITLTRPERMQTVAYRADGKVTTIQAESNVLYINLGRRDRIVPGLTFSVYSAERGMPRITESDGSVVEALKLRGKAQIYVVRPYEKISECRVEWIRDAHSPVVAGDLIGNLAFDPNRTYRFVVVGGFDLYGSGLPKPADKDRLTQLIRHFRGEVTSDVNEQTDFVIVGAKPAELPPVDDQESPHQLAVRKAIEKQRAHYDATLDTAKAHQVQILNTNEFLALIGYTPENTLRMFTTEGR